jgi:signal transduction histidine kinase/ActR/RegA family two-component response regulator
MPRRLNVLMADESAIYADRAVDALRHDGYEVAWERVERAADLAAALERQRWDLILANDGLPGFNALSVLRVLHEHAKANDDAPGLVIISESLNALDVDRIRDAIREGARDCVAPGDLARLLIVVDRELRDRDQRDEQRRAEAQLRQTQKLEAISQLAGGVAHDFNNLLTAILAYSESMLYQLPADSPLRIEVAEIKKSGERASALTQRLLAFGRRRTAKPQVTNLNGLIAGLEQTIRRTLGDHIDVTLQLAPDLGHVRVDVGHFEQALLNLVANARDAMPAGGTLTVRTTNLDLREGAPRPEAAVAAQAQAASLTPGLYVALSVADTGTGMDAGTQARAFEPFFTTHESGQGSGLGLPMVYGTIQQSGGSIATDSVVGRGTTMRILLPRAQADAVITHAAAPSAASSPAPVILLVEDEELVRQMAVLTLERRGYRVLVANDATEAIARAMAHAGDIHLLIADLVMPRISGQELARVLRQTRPGLRVLHTVSYGDDPARELAAADPHASFLQKPFVATALADRVREALAGERASAGGRSPGAAGRWPTP